MELDDAYSNGAYIFGANAFPDRWANAAEMWRNGQALADHARLDLPYGRAPRERFDLFLPDGAPKGLMVFVHGGYWLDFDRSYWSHLAAGAQGHGWAVAIPSYTLAPNARIGEITAQISHAVRVAADMVAGPIVLTGHSAGGHLVARMLDKTVLDQSIADRLRRVVPISPLADLRPLLRTSMKNTLRLSEKEAAAESPVLMVDRYDIPVTVWVGGDERPAFLDQSQWLVDAWKCDHVVDPGRHHFDVIEPLEIADSALIETLLA